MADASDVNRLLDASRAAHLAYRYAANPAPPGRPNYPLAEQHVAKALSLRLDAHEADPQHHASGWAEDRAPHDTICAFYRKYITIPDSGAAIVAP